MCGIAGWVDFDRYLTDERTAADAMVDTMSCGVKHNMIGRKLMSVYNDKGGVFHNTDDDIGGLEHALGRHFSEVTVDVVGIVALFRASR